MYTEGMNVKEFARLGGKARAKALSKERRVEIARNAGLASSSKRKADLKLWIVKTNAAPDLRVYAIDETHARMKVEKVRQVISIRESTAADYPENILQAR